MLLTRQSGERDHLPIMLNFLENFLGRMPAVKNRRIVDSEDGCSSFSPAVDLGAGPGVAAVRRACGRGPFVGPTSKTLMDRQR